MNIGVNSKIIDGFSNLYETLNPFDVNFIELSIRDSGILNYKGIINKEIFKKITAIASTINTKFSVHAPHVSASSLVKLDLADGNIQRNVKIMRNVFEIANNLEAKFVVIHGGILKDPVKSVENTVLSIKEISKVAEEYSLYLLLENVHPFKKGQIQIGTTPLQLRDIYRRVNEDNLKITLDIGHAFLSSVKYKFKFFRWFDLLSPYIYHIHIHDNFGNSDMHLPLGKGIIKFFNLFDAINKTNAQNVILEIKTRSRDLAKENLNFLDKFLN